MVEEIADIRERQEALDPTRSFVVQAPAGSGKTELLMQRYLVLLACAERPEQILAITFTRKAAGEMQNRVILSLEKAASGKKPTAPHEEQTLSLARAVLERSAAQGWELLENPSRLRIQTIDSFCAGLVRLTPLLSHLGRPPEIAEDPDELYREAAARTIEMVEEESPGGAAVRKALGHLDNSVVGLSRRLVAMLEKRDQWRRHVEDGGGEGLRALIEGSMRSLVEETLEGVRDAFPDGLAERLLPAARYAASNLAASGKNSPITALEGIQGMPGPRAADLALWKGIKELLLTGVGGVRKPGGVNVNLGFPRDKTEEAVAAKDGFRALLGELEQNDVALDALATVGALPAPAFSDRDWEILEAIVRLLPIASAHLEAVFAETGRKDHQSVSMAALDALGGELDPTELMLSLDMRIRHILVDEYQDTSRSQLSLIEALVRGWEPGDGRTLFIVGDPMQSIYLFREAQVGLFLDALRSGVGTVKLDFLRLTTNFRSGTSLVDWVNNTFAPAFPEEEDSFTGAVRYVPSVAVKGGPADPVTVRLYPARDDAAEAVEIISVIKSLPGDETVAVLCRSRSHVSALVEAFKRESIGFRAQDMDPMAGRPVILDLFVLLRALAHPYDRVAWLAVLRAPWCGLTLSDLHALCCCDSASPVFRLMNDPSRLATLSEDGRQRLSRVARAFASALSAWGRANVREVLEGLWIRLGGPACAPDERSAKDAEGFFTMLEDSGAVVTQEDIRVLEERLEKTYADHGGDADTRIDVMTVHRAKGLEFDNVIIPGLGRKPRNEDKKLMLWMERGDGLLLAPIERKAAGEPSPIYSYLSLINRQKAEHEKTRQLYVAATRARKGLYLFGHVKEGGDGEVRSHEKTAFLSVIEHALTARMVSATAPLPNPVTEAPPRAAPLKRLPVDWAMPEPAGAVAAQGEERPGVSTDEQVEFHWAGEVRRHIGTVVHGYLCRIAREGLQGWSAERVEKESGRMEARLRTLGLGAAAARRAAVEAASTLKRALSDKRGRWALSTHEQGDVEYPLTGVVEGGIVHAVMDRTFVEDGVRWVVDYKSSTHEGGSVEAFLESERERYSRQLEKYAALLRAAGEEREIRTGLYYPALGAWVEL